MLQIGSLSLESLVMLAPMAGVCDTPFKRVVRRYDPHSLLSSEIVNADALVGGDREMRERLRLHPEEHPAALQIAGHDPDKLAEAALLAQEAGADLVDFNCGCPSPQLVRSGNGAALLRDPERMPELLKALRKACKVPMTVKVRLGWNEKESGLAIARMAQDLGADAVWVHGRTAVQQYHGEADWEAIARFKAKLSIPVIGNGDVFEPMQARERWRESGVDAVAIGRGAMGNPWIFKRAAHAIATGDVLSEPSVRERIEACRLQVALLIAEIGEHRGVRESRKHVGWYTQGLPNTEALKAAVNGALSAQQVDDALAHYLAAQPHPDEQDAPWRPGELLDAKWRRYR